MHNFKELSKSIHKVFFYLHTYIAYICINNQQLIHVGNIQKACRQPVFAYIFLFIGRFSSNIVALFLLFWTYLSLVFGRDIPRFTCFIPVFFAFVTQKNTSIGIFNALKSGIFKDTSGNILSKNRSLVVKKSMDKAKTPIYEAKKVFYLHFKAFYLHTNLIFTMLRLYSQSITSIQTMHCVYIFKAL